MCLTLFDPRDCSLPGSCVHGILRATVLEWVAMTSSRASSWHRDRTHVSCRQIVYHSATWQVLVTDKTVAEVPSKNPTSLKPQTPTTGSIAGSSLSVNEPTVLPVTYFFFLAENLIEGNGSGASGRLKRAREHLWSQR